MAHYAMPLEFFLTMENIYCNVMAFCWIVQVIMAFLCVFECHEKPSKSFFVMCIIKEMESDVENSQILS